MKMNTLEKLYLCLRDLKPEVVLDGTMSEAAKAPIMKMLELSK
jgi:quinolinate synthase